MSELSIPLFIKKNQNTLIQYAGLLLVLIAFTVMTDGALLSDFNIRTILKQLVVLFTISVGMVFVFSHGGMDISAGAVIALSSMVAIYTINAGAPLAVGVLAAIAVSVACYMVNVIISNLFGLMAVISSLAIMFVARGLVTYQVSTSSAKIALTDTGVLREIGRSMPIIITIIVLVGVVGYVIFHFTKIGKHSKAIGDNPLAASQSGVRVKYTKLISYAIAGVLVGCASILSLSRSAVVSENTGMGMEMDVIVALVLGGMALNGGSRSKMSSAFVGSITYVVLNNGLVMVGVAPEVVSLIRGIIFLLVVFLLLRRPRGEVMPR
ncbi:monosaccharide-transporting ATPase [Paenibacillus montaniterrae]|uniref:Monosaccharide-transporting ATPase n=1 Tax=Paenibacillus montaniterrae TaxID=429341 RepID=A0A919YQJ4_9BACL|nr:ABC transporter permease [Paenibacillus montaniterrae]GIP17590.1 monosaccharide-transporting ATPase [Paenibacillus montaniterrae]